MSIISIPNYCHGPVTRCVKLWVAHAPGIPRTLSPPLTSEETYSYRSRYASWHVRDARAVMHVRIAKPRWRGKHSRHSRRVRNPKFQVSGRRPMAHVAYTWIKVQIKVTLGTRVQSYLNLTFFNGLIWTIGTRNANDMNVNVIWQLSAIMNFATSEMWFQ